MKRILLVEDDSGTALSLKDRLTTEGYTVQVVGDGQAGLEHACGSSFDLILLDLILPKKDGYTVCRELRLHNNFTPILMLTERITEEETVEGLNLGANDYVAKPFSLAVLCARVRVLLREHTEVYRFGEFEVDLRKGTLQRNAQSLTVTPLEFKLLCVFLRNRGTLMTLEDLRIKVWERINVTHGAIVNHIQHLREKLEPGTEDGDGRKPVYFVNVHGRGYRFDG